MPNSAIAARKSNAFIIVWFSDLEVRRGKRPADMVYLNSELIRTKCYNLFRSPDAGCVRPFLLPVTGVMPMRVSLAAIRIPVPRPFRTITRGQRSGLFGSLSLPCLFRRNVTGAAWFPTSTVSAPWRAGRLSVCIMCGAGMCRAARASIVLVPWLAKCRFQFLADCGCVPGVPKN